MFVATVAVAADQPRWKTVAADLNWLWSKECSILNTIEIPGVGVADDQCAPEAELKRRLREESIDFGPGPSPEIKSPD